MLSKFILPLGLIGFGAYLTYLSQPHYENGPGGPTLVPGIIAFWIGAIMLIRTVVKGARKGVMAVGQSVATSRYQAAGRRHGLNFDLVVGGVAFDTVARRLMVPSESEFLLDAVFEFHEIKEIHAWSYDGDPGRAAAITSAGFVLRNGGFKGGQIITVTTSHYDYPTVSYHLERAIGSEALIDALRADPDRVVQQINMMAADVLTGKLKGADTSKLPPIWRTEMMPLLAR